MGAHWIKTAAAMAVAVTLSLVGGGPALAAKRVALVVGNDQYANIPQLKKAVNDARTMSEYAQEARLPRASGRKSKSQGTQRVRVPCMPVLCAYFPMILERISFFSYSSSRDFSL